MTAVAVELLTRPPEPTDVAEAGTLSTLALDAVEFVADTDTLITMCACIARLTEPSRRRTSAIAPARLPTSRPTGGYG
jgi:hypothetical protein